MTDWNLRVGAMNLPVADLDELRAFYARVFEVEPLGAGDDELIYQFGDLFLAFRLDPSHEAADGSALRLARRGLGQLCLGVDDVTRAAADLEAVGVRLLCGPTDHSWGIRTVTFADPAGYLWELAQDTPS